MTADPLGPIAEAFDAAARAWQLDNERSRDHWDDEARRLFDRRYGNQVGAESRAAAREIRLSADELRAALRTLEAG